MKQIIQTPPLSDATSQGIISGNMLFISGQIANDPVIGKLISSDIEMEMIQVMENVKLILNTAGVDFSNVLKTSIYVKDIKHLGVINKVYNSYFSGDYPACEIIQATALQKNANIEMSIIAASR